MANKTMEELLLEPERSIVKKLKKRLKRETIIKNLNIGTAAVSIILTAPTTVYTLSNEMLPITFIADTALIAGATAAFFASKLNDDKIAFFKEELEPYQGMLDESLDYLKDRDAKIKRIQNIRRIK